MNGVNVCVNDYISLYETTWWTSEYTLAPWQWVLPSIELWKTNMLGNRFFNNVPYFINGGRIFKKYVLMNFNFFKNIVKYVNKMLWCVYKNVSFELQLAHFSLYFIMQFPLNGSIIYND